MKKEINFYPTSAQNFTIDEWIVNSGLKFPLNNGLKIPFLHITLGNYRHAPVGCRPVSFLSFDMNLLEC